MKRASIDTGELVLVIFMAIAMILCGLILFGK
jgi:hypothetical protein